MAHLERGVEPQTKSWHELYLSMAAVGALAAGLLLSGCTSSIPEVA